MRTNIEIDDELMAAALNAGPYKTKKDAVEAGLKLIARQAAYREVLQWEGKLRWDGDAWDDHEPLDATATLLSTGEARPALKAAQPIDAEGQSPVRLRPNRHGGR